MNTEPIYIIKADGTRELFDRTKLEGSLRKSGTDEKEIMDIVSEVYDGMTPGMTSHDVYKRAFNLLYKKNKPVALKYSLKRAVMELGPSGFPFEKFVAEIFNNMGFETLTGQTVKGFCVEHEVDVVAWNKEKLIMVEAKFHNQPGVKSDLKVALYVKARFEDLSKVTFNYDGEERKLDEGWLVTNTKFTTTAIEYGSCQGALKMIGWNYPPEESLRDMIIKAKMHPLTCLASLEGREKKELLQRGVVLCKTIEENAEILEDIGLTKEKIDKVMSEISLL